MKNFHEATSKFYLTNKPQYIIYNHLKSTYRISCNMKYNVNEELTNKFDG
jgi:hypothetical protein